MEWILIVYGFCFLALASMILMLRKDIKILWSYIEFIQHNPQWDFDHLAKDKKDK